MLDAQLGNRQAMDPIVSAVTHRKLHPPPPPKPTAAAHGGGAGGARGGSRLGPVAPAPALLAPPGAAAAAAAGGAATPAAGLTARPSEQSLGGLLGMGTGGGEPAAGMELDVGPPGVSASEAAALAQQTAERRRLNLESLDSPAEVLTAKGRRRNEQQTASSSSELEEGEGEEGSGGAEVPGAKPAPSADELEASMDPPSSMVLAGDSGALGGHRHGRASAAAAAAGTGTGEEGGLDYAASVDLIDAPISEMESEQAEML